LKNNINLTQLFLNNNKLEKLNLINNVNLNKLYIYNNKMIEIDLSQNPKINELYISENNFTSITFWFSPVLKIGKTLFLDGQKSQTCQIKLLHHKENVL
jgi:hypothetical protein